MTWILLLLTAAAFGVGFAFSWIRMRRRMQAHVDQQVEAEIRRQIQQRVLAELSRGGAAEQTGRDNESKQGKP